MIKNYFKIAVRNLWRNKGFSAINITGLAVGFACCILIMLYIVDENSYDKHHKESTDIYRMGTEFKSPTGTEMMPTSSAPFAYALKNELPEVEHAVRVLKMPGAEKNILSNEEASQPRSFFESNGFYVDSTFFSIFSYSFLYGSPQKALESPNSVILSEQTAKKLFGDKNPVEKTVRISSQYGSNDYRITGVFKKEHASHINAEYFMSMRNRDIGTWVESINNWAVNNLFYTYLKLRHGTSPKIFENKLAAFLAKHGAADLKAAGFSKRLFLQAVPDIHLHSSLKFDISANGNIKFLYILGTIALFLLLIACVNFMNLSTARSAKRAKEVGIRKVVGAFKGSLIKQFLGESLVISFIALIMSVFLLLLFLPLFRQITDKQLGIFNNYRILLAFVGISIVTGILAGLYPSFYLSSFNPQKVLKGETRNPLSAIFIRKGLVVFQFVISICLILGTIVIWQQMNFIKSRDIGFNKEQQLVIPLQSNEAWKSYRVLMNEMKKNPGIISAAGASTYPGIRSVNDMNYYTEGKNVKDAIHISWNNVDFGLIESIGFKIIKGRSFSRDFPGDTSNGIILNETAIKELRLDQNNAVGKKIYFDWEGQTSFSQIIGIVKDFNYESLHTPIHPFALTMQFMPRFNYIIARINAGHVPKLLADLEKLWKRTNRETPFEYSFLDEDFQKNYEADERLSRLITYFAFITIFVSCLGLFALAAYTAEKRTKEIGIRKVLGASVGGIVQLLSKEFLKLVLIASLIAFPIGWWASNKWLQDFSYRTNINWWVFVLAAIVAFLIALVTVSFQAMKAALANPVRSLRTE